MTENITEQPEQQIKIVYIRKGATDAQKKASKNYYSKNKAAAIKQKSEYVNRIKNTEKYKEMRRAISKRAYEKKKALKASANQPVLATDNEIADAMRTNNEIIFNI